MITQLTEPRRHGEGPHWDNVDQVLYYVDISSRVLYRYDPANNSEKSISFGKLTMHWIVMDLTDIKCLVKELTDEMVRDLHLFLCS